MKGISSGGKEAIGQKVEDLFDRIALEFIGDIPRLRNKKTIVISSKRNFGLADLFVQSMRDQNPNVVERDALKGLLNSAFDYVEALKSRTRVVVTERIDGLIRESKLGNRSVTEYEVQAILDEELERAKSQLRGIAEAESTKLRNMGTLMDITRVASDLDDADPTVFFVVVKDTATCKECMRLHLMPDGNTPRLWKFSELKQGYHKRSENNPSAFGLHPHCRCTLTYLAKGFGFENGRVSYKSENHDEYSKQRKS